MFRYDERPRQASSEGTRAKYNADVSGSYQIPQYRSRASQADASASCRHLSPFLIKCCEKTGQVTSALDQATSATLHKPPSMLVFGRISSRLFSSALPHTRLFSSTSPSVKPAMSISEKKNIVVVGGSYTGSRAVTALAEKMGTNYKVLLVEKQSHFNHLFGFPRVAVVPGFEHMAFVPYTKAFSTLPEGSAEVQVVQARATEVQPEKVVLVRGEPIPYEFLVMATGTKLAPPGTLHTEGKVDGIAYFQEHQRQIKRAKNIVVVGGGAVGVREWTGSCAVAVDADYWQSSPRTSRTTTRISALLWFTRATVLCTSSIVRCTLSVVSTFVLTSYCSQNG